MIATKEIPRAAAIAAATSERRAFRPSGDEPPSFRDGDLAFYPTTLTVRLPVGRRIETTRFLQPDDPGFDETVAELDLEGFERTKMHQALAIKEASREFPCRQVSFLVTGETFYAPDRNGTVRNCHAAWDATSQRFDLFPTHGDLSRFLVAVTKVEYP